MDVLAVHDAAGRALTTVRNGGGPVFLELRTYRFRAHSMFDPDLYRDDAEIDAWKQRDPITTFGDRLVGAGDLTSSDIDELWSGAREEIEAAISFAEAGTLEPVDQLTRHVLRREVA